MPAPTILPPAGQHAFILQQLDDVIVTADLDFHVRSLNAAAVRHFGIDPDGAVGCRISELVAFEYSPAEPLEAIKAQVATTGRWQGELPFAGRDGQRHYFWFTLTFLPGADGRPEGILVIGRDRTAERIAEQNLHRKERFYRGLIADALDGILLMDVSGRITFASPSIKHVLGYDYAEVLGKWAFDFVHPEDHSKASEAFMREVNQNAEIKFINVRLRRKDGPWLWCLVRGNNLLANPSVGGIAIYFHDDSQRKEASEALKASEQRFRLLVRNIQSGVMMFNVNGVIETCNEAATRILGLPPETLMGTALPAAAWGVISEHGAPITPDQLPALRAIRTGQPVRNFVMGHLHPVTGRRIWLLVNADPVFDEQQVLQYVIASFADISERKALEDRLLAEQISHQRQLTQATIDSSERERTEIGKELHDNIGQQLTTIKLYLDLAKATADEETLEMVALANRNISDVINEIRALCRNLIPSTLGDLGLEESINDLVYTITRTQHLRIRFSCEGFDEESVPDNRKLMFFRILQEQLNNIVKHAGATRVDITLGREGGTAFLRVADDGKGFDPASVRRGLGLTNMENRAGMFGGTVEIQSVSGKGSTITVAVPLPEDRGA
ncbi:PAS domain S-box protein [Flaviaesturariibacter flavus]|uniref:Oxygen sensor histidine kinase NreB n=1 Tax=Flaviaesturariibacter flavus TaxID=2502780 RepID=A0A4R1BIP3_9BACT|nr:PAS domain S-box protein [Flaviaesturariibacter flavus]TCJ17038.1 PAS domain S-box protein [Flaviaesturariibacter flavus]